MSAIIVRLIAQGTAAQPIVLTSAEASPAPGALETTTRLVSVARAPVGALDGTGPQARFVDDGRAVARRR